MSIDIAAIRFDYARAGLDERDVAPNPITQLQRWLDDAISAKHPEPTAMTVATIDASGDPAARVVLCKGVDDRGLVFFTNYESDKGKQLTLHPRASASFFWVLLERQVRVTGAVSEVARAESEAYFASRPRESQLGAWASAQSAVVAGRAAIEARLAEFTARFEGKDVPCPPRWGGYLIQLETMELWQGRPSRLHDRLRYARKSTASGFTKRDGAEAWQIERLSP